MTTTRRHAGKTLIATALAAASFGITPYAFAQETIKVGVLHSLSGTMAISETVLKDTAYSPASSRTSAACCSAWPRKA